MSKTVNCERCGGSGIIPEFKHVNGGTCFKCNGSGQQEISERAYKAREARDARFEAEQERLRQQVLVAFLPASRNTFKDKEIIKQLGFKFDRNNGWIIFKCFANMDEVKAYKKEFEAKAQALGLDGVLGTEVENRGSLYDSPQEAQRAIREGMDELGY